MFNTVYEKDKATNWFTTMNLKKAKNKLEMM